MVVHVKSPARLHFGIIDLGGRLGRRYGSIGVAIDQPSVKVHAEKSDDVSAICQKGIEISPAEIKDYVNRVIDHFKIPGGVRIKIEEGIPKHVGLGSTTQTALSVAAAITRLYGVNASTRDLSALLGRGEISGIGTAAFEDGCFIVDGGVKAGGGPPPVLLRIGFPEDWFFAVVIPAHKKGLSEREEKRIFEKISAPPSYAKEISHLLLMKMLPAIAEKNIKNFGDALTVIQTLVGKSFSRYQEGPYHSRISERLARFLLKNGAYGSGQSSWGPTVYGVVEGMGNCKKLKGKAEKFMKEKGFDGYAFCTAANNQGASVKG